MKHPRFLLFFIYSMTSVAQTPAALPQTLPKLAAILPRLVRTQPKPFDFGPFSDAGTAALQRAPASAADAIPVLSRDLQEPDPQVQFNTLAILYGLTLQPNGVELIAPHSAQNIVLAMMKDTGMPSKLRERLLYTTALEFAGRLIADNIIEVVNNSSNKQMRNAGIAAAMRVGPAALSGIGSRLNQIVTDPSESSRSHKIALEALYKINPGFHVE